MNDWWLYGRTVSELKLCIVETPGSKDKVVVTPCEKNYFWVVVALSNCKSTSSGADKDNILGNCAFDLKHGIWDLSCDKNMGRPTCRITNNFSNFPKCLPLLVKLPLSSKGQICDGLIARYLSHNILFLWLCATFHACMIKGTISSLTCLTNGSILWKQC